LKHIFTLVIKIVKKKKVDKLLTLQEGLTNVLRIIAKHFVNIKPQEYKN